MTNRHKAIILMVIGSLIGGTMGVVIKLGLRDIPPLGFVAARVIISLIFLAPFIIQSRVWAIKNKLRLMLFSLLATANIGLFVVGLAQTTAIISACLYAGVPLITALLSHWFYQEKLSSRKLLGVVVGLLGASLVILTPVINRAQLGSLTGNLIVALAVISFSFHTVLSKKMHRHHSSNVINQFFILTASLVLTPLALGEMSQTGNWLRTVSFNSSASLLYVALIGTVVQYFIYLETVRFATPLVASLQLYLVPVFGVLFASIFLKEALTPELALGAALVLTSIWLVTKSNPNQDLEKTRKKW